MFSLSAHSTAEMLNIRIEFRYVVPSNIYDPSFKAARKKQWCLGAGLGWGGGVTNIFIIYLGGVEKIFPKGLGGGRQVFCPPHENVTAPPPHLVINDSSLSQNMLSFKNYW